MSLAGISLVTLGVDDIPVATAFYEALGWETAPQSQEAIAFLQGHNIVLALYGNEAIANDLGVSYEPTEFPAVTLAVNFPSVEEVDQLFRTAVDAGADAVRRPDETFWGGYSGNYRDPDGHMWEVAHNPFFKFDASGKLALLS